jgi:hypothetical protein
MAASQNTVTVQVRNVYGVSTIYPMCDTARRFAAIAGTKTLTPSVVSEIRAIGFQIVEIGSSAAFRKAA